MVDVFMKVKIIQKTEEEIFSANQILTLFCERGCLHRDVEMAIALGDSDVGEQRCH